MNVDFNIKASYEILSDELKKHGIVGFFTSEEAKFKKKMVKDRYWVNWNKIYTAFDDEVRLPGGWDYTRNGYEAALKSYKSSPFHGVIDKINQATFERVLTNCSENKDWEDMVSFIISEFIAFKSEFQDFSDVVETMKEAKFSKNSITKVGNAFRKHKELYSPKNGVSTRGGNNNKLLKNTNSMFNKTNSFSENFKIKEVVKILEAFNDCIGYSNNRRGKVIIDTSKEAGVQDILYFMLKPYITDLVPEQPNSGETRQYSIQDFRSKSLKLIIEAKRIRDKAHGKSIKKEINDDIANYRHDSDCENLIIVIYDPDKNIESPSGLIRHADGKHTHGEKTLNVQTIIKT